MPYIHLATTSDLAENGQIPDILRALVDSLSSTDAVDSKSVKSYHTLLSVWEMGDGAPAGFARCTVSLLAGRDEATRVAIADRLYAVLRDQFSESLSNEEIALTLEIREMDKATYRK